jgi:hypothetical protein
MAEQQTPSGDERSEQGARETTGRRRGRVGALAAVAVTIALVAAFAVVALSRQGAIFALQRSLPAADVDWQVYHDQLGLFTMRLPPGWTASSSLGTFSQGDSNSSESGQLETITFIGHAQGASSPSIQVSARQITNSTFAQSLECNSRPRETTTFNGYPADESMTAVIFFESGNAHFQIDETIPGVLAPENPGGPMNPPTPPPPPPAATVTAERALLADALASFQPSDAKPLTCS